MPQIDPSLVKYHLALRNLGNTLKTKLPCIDWLFDRKAGVWTANDPKDIAALRKKCDNQTEWRTFIGMSDLIVFDDISNLFGFTLD